MFVAAIEAINAMMEMDIIANYAQLVALKKKIVEIPNIKRWIETRPKTLR